jgi:hypothetical protein
VVTAKAAGMAPPVLTIRETLNTSSYVVPAQAGTQIINALDSLAPGVFFEIIWD